MSINKTVIHTENQTRYQCYFSVGNCNTSRPGMMDFKGKAKWDAWDGKKGTSQDEAKKRYMELAKKMAEKHGTA